MNPLQLQQLRTDLAHYARKRDGASDKAERKYYAQLWQDAVDRLRQTLIYK